MLKVDYTKWNESPETLLDRALNSEHRRTRERFLALYNVTQGSYPTQEASRLGRHAQSVIKWVNDYNDEGPDALTYRRPGGASPLLTRASPKKSTES